jgi:cation transport ATPase
MNAGPTRPARTAARHAHREGQRLSRRRAHLAYAVFSSAWITGVLWLIFHYFLSRPGEFGAEPNPLETWWLRPHGACALATLWIGGLLWAVHIRPALARIRRRRSGMLLLAMLALLALTGYLLYYVGDEGARDWVRWLHWSVGIVVVVALFAHGVHQRTRSGRREAASAQNDQRGGGSRRVNLTIATSPPPVSTRFSARSSGSSNRESPASSSGES